MQTKVFQLAQFKAVNQEQGVFEALVAVFNNIDRGGDKILPGAFADSLAEWEAKGRPIPVVFAHQWDNLDAHIGQVLEAKETDEGLFVRGRLDMDEPFAQRVFKKMQAGTLAEFSFAYDIVESAWIDQGEKATPRHFRELRKLDLLEVGPCLVGMNPDTQLLDLKEGRRNAAADLARLQKIHDLAVELGCKCGQADDSASDGEGGDEGKARKGKPSDSQPSTYATRVALDLLELGAD